MQNSRLTWVGTLGTDKGEDEGHSGQEQLRLPRCHIDVGREEVIEALLVLVAWPQQVESGKNRRCTQCSWDDPLELRLQGEEAGVCTYSKGWLGSAESLMVYSGWGWNWQESCLHLAPPQKI